MECSSHQWYLAKFLQERTSSNLLSNTWKKICKHEMALKFTTWYIIFLRLNLIRSPITKKRLINSLSANPTKWPNSLKQFVGNLVTNCLSVFDHFVELAPKRLSFFRTLQKILSRPIKSSIVVNNAWRISFD